MKHKHCEMIKAKAENMDLVLFHKTNTGSNGNKWGECNSSHLPEIGCYDYFLCLPKHKEACLHWLNGGEVESRLIHRHDQFFEQEKFTEESISSWNCENWWMYETASFRIKPRKEKRWICVHTESGEVGGNYYDTKEGCQESINEHYDHSEFQFIEIEVEV